MARRNGRPGAWLGVDSYTGFTRFQSQLKIDFWNQPAQKPLKRNLQELAISLADPYPVFPVQAPSYETVASVSALVSAPTFIGVTTRKTNLNAPAIQAGVVKA